MWVYRVTKYDPTCRNADGTFVGSDWTSVDDVGGVFDGRTLDVRDYLAVEDQYVSAVERAIRLSALGGVRISDLERHDVSQPELVPKLDLGFLERDDHTLSVSETLVLTRAALRELVWARVRGDRGFYVHFGYDFYMYLGGEAARLESVSADGLYVEPSRSPYFEASTGAPEMSPSLRALDE